MGLTIKEYPAIKVKHPLKNKGLFATYWAADNGLCVYSNNPVHQVFFDKIINDKLTPKIDSGEITPRKLV